jgi:hypothetical protein
MLFHQDADAAQNFFIARPFNFRFHLGKVWLR